MPDYDFNDLVTHRGGKGLDWVSEDDYSMGDKHQPNGGIYAGNKARVDGYQARAKGVARTENPHKEGHPDRKEWHEGWDDHHYLHNNKTYSETHMADHSNEPIIDVTQPPKPKQKETEETDFVRGFMSYLKRGLGILRSRSKRGSLAKKKRKF